MPGKNSLKHSIKTKWKYIPIKINKIRNLVEERQLEWQAVNEVSGRKITSKAKLKAVGQKEIIRKDHFKYLIENIPEITEKSIEKIINPQLGIKFVHFTEEEIDAVLKKI